MLYWVSIKLMRKFIEFCQEESTLTQALLSLKELKRELVSTKLKILYTIETQSLKLILKRDSMLFYQELME